MKQLPLYVLSIVALAAVAALAAGTTTRADTAFCGGSAPLQTTIGVEMKPQKSFRSAQAVAALVQKKTTLPQAWIAWDETGQPWLEFNTATPQAVLNWYHVKREDFAGAKSGFAPLRGASVSAPGDYALLACSAVSSSLR